MKPTMTEVAVLALLLGFAVLLAHGWPEGESFWGAASAIAATFAAFAALYISRRQERLAARQQRKIAAIATARVVWVLNQFSESLYRFQLANQLAQHFDTPEDKVSYLKKSDTYENHQRAWKLMAELISDEQLVSMFIVPQGFSLKVAEVITKSKNISIELEKFHSWLNVIPKIAPFDIQRAEKYWRQLDAIYDEVKSIKSIGELFLKQEQIDYLPF